MDKIPNAPTPARSVDKGGQALLSRVDIGQNAGIVDANNKDAFIAAAKTRQWNREICSNLGMRDLKYHF